MLGLGGCGAAGAGLWPAGSGVPNDAGIIAQLTSEKLIARGVGEGPTEVSLYDDPGVHIFMSIDGRFFGTSDGGGGGNRKGGAGWLNDGAPDAWSRTYRRYHLLPSVLRGTTGAGHSVTFQTGALEPELASLTQGEKVNVSYEEDAAGFLIATSIASAGSPQSAPGRSSS